MEINSIGTTIELIFGIIGIIELNNKPVYQFIFTNPESNF